MATKRIIHCDTTAWTVYVIIVRESDGYLLNDADGSFASAPADPYLALSEHATVKGRYSVSESRQVWNDGEYSAVIYKQIGGSPAPATDTVIGNGEIVIKDDAEVVLDVLPSTRLATSAYTAPDNAAITAIQAKTDTIAWQNIIDLHDEAFGTWVVDPAAGTLTLKRPNGSTLKVFNLTSTNDAVPAYIERTPQ